MPLLPDRGKYFIVSPSCQPVDATESGPELAAQCDGICQRAERQEQLLLRNLHFHHLSVKVPHRFC